MITTAVVLAAMLVCVRCKEFILEMETFASATQRTSRSGAGGRLAVHLKQADVVKLSFCLTQESNVSVRDLVYSNDGPSDTFSLQLGDKIVGRAVSGRLLQKGMGWNAFHSAAKQFGSVRPVTLSAGKHDLIVKVLRADRWGAELDKVVLDINDDQLVDAAFRCSSFCFGDIVYGQLPTADLLPSGRFVKTYSPTNCAEEDNVQVNVFHETATAFELSANLPKYQSFANSRNPDFTNCVLPTPIWIFRNLTVSPGTPRANASLASFFVSGSPQKTEFYFSFSLRDMSSTREVDLSSAETVLLVVLRNMPRENVRIQLMYASSKGKWIPLPNQEFSSFETNRTWTLPSKIFSRNTMNRLRLIIEPGKQTNVIIDTIRLDTRFRSDKPFTIYSDRQLVIQGVRMGFWQHWPDRMMVRGGNHADSEHRDVDSLRIYSKVPWTSGFSQVLVLFQNGRTRIQPVTPHGLDWVPFGSSVTIGQPVQPNMQRPYAPIQLVTILSTDPLALNVEYKNGNTAEFVLFTSLNETRLILRKVNFRQNRSMFPIMTFQSMWIMDGNADVDHVTVDSGPPRHIVSDWKVLHGLSAVFFRQCISKHNTLSSDITVKMLPE